jgi:hypothetical protein
LSNKLQSKVFRRDADKTFMFSYAPNSLVNCKGDC